MEELFLVVPSLEYEQDILLYKNEFDPHEHMAGSTNLRNCESVQQWLSEVEALRCERTLSEGQVPTTTLLCVRRSDGRVVGMVNIRHRLNDFLASFGGHIGYSVRESERRQGYATEMLRQALEICRARGLKEVLIVCSRENVASAKTILANGGLLENEVVDQGVHLQRYWIAL